MAETVKVSMNLPVREAAVVAGLADAHSITKTDVVRRGIVLEKFIEDVAELKGKILIERADGSIERLVLPWIE